MTGELVLVSGVVGLFGGWVFGLVMGHGGFGVLGDLALGLVGGPPAVWIYQAVDLMEYAGIFGAIVVAFLGAVAVVFGQRRLAGVNV